MKKSFALLCLAMVFASTRIASAQPKSAIPASTDHRFRWTPLMLSAYPDKWMLPRAHAVYGLEVSIGKSGAQKARGFQVAAIWAAAKDVDGFQIGAIKAESETVDGFQIALLPVTLRRLRGLQIGLINNMQFENEGDRMRVSGIQLGAMNWTKRTNGFQIGILNSAERLRGSQLGVMNYSMNTRAFQLGIANLVGLTSDQGFQAKGFQLGLVNVTTQDFAGLQIGLFNSCQRLKGVQLGLVNYVHNPRQPRLLLVPLINVGW